MSPEVVVTACSAPDPKAGPVRERLPLPAVLLLATALGLGACGPAAEPPAEGGAAEAAGPDHPAGSPGRRPAPEFTLPRLDGGELSLADLRGRVVVIDFWATWCPPCIFQIPILNEIHERYAGRGVEVLGISVDTAGADAVRGFAKEQGIAYPVLLGDESLARAYGAPGYPSLVVVAPDGTIPSGPPHVGVVDLEQLSAELDALLAGGSTATAAGSAAPPAPEI